VCAARPETMDRFEATPPRTDPLDSENKAARGHSHTAAARFRWPPECLATRPNRKWREWDCQKTPARRRAAALRATEPPFPAFQCESIRSPIPLIVNCSNEFSRYKYASTG